MKEKEINSQYEYSGTVINGFLMLVLYLLLVGGLGIGGMILADPEPAFGVPMLLLAFLLLIFIPMGFFVQQPNQSRVMIFFGKYRGTFFKTGYYWVNPFMSRRQISLRILNMDVMPIKVNDKTGNPVMIGMVLVWRVKDTYRAVFDVDSGTGNAAVVTGNGITKALDGFVRIQSDAALREVTSRYAYDNDENGDEVTLRSSSDEINRHIEEKLNERLAMAGIEVIEARLNYLAYAPEIAAVMLRRQQASAIIAAREKIVEGAVSMVKMAIDQLEGQGVVELDPARKAAMVSNLLVVLCGDDPAQPVVNTGE